MFLHGIRLVDASFLKCCCAECSFFCIDYVGISCYGQEKIIIYQAFDELLKESSKCR